MHILFAIHELAPNGAVVALLRMVQHLRARGHQVTILRPAASGPAAALEPEFRGVGATLASQVSNFARFDVAVGCTIFADKIMGHLAGTIPTLWWIVEGLLGPAILRERGGLAALHQVDRLVFPTAPIHELYWQPLLGQLPPGRVEVIAPAVPPPPGQPKPRDGVAFRVVCVGSVYPRKRQADLVRAVAQLDRPGLHCVLVGQFFELEGDADKLVKAQPERFTVTGVLPGEEVRAWQRSADAVCLPSDDETFGISPIEGAWYGVPPLLSDLPAYRGIWRHGGNALLHPVGDVTLLRWNLRMLMDDAPLRARLAAAARQVPLRFTPERCGTQFEAALAEAAAAFKER